MRRPPPNVLYTMINSPKRLRRSRDGLPKFTSGLEGRLARSVGKPSGPVRKYLQRRFYHETNPYEIDDGTKYQYYMAQKEIVHIDFEAKLVPFEVTTRSTSLTVELNVDKNDTVVSFNFQFSMGSE